MVVNLRGWRGLVAVLAVFLVSTASVASAAKGPIGEAPEISGLVDVAEGVNLSAATGAEAGKIRVMVELLEPPAAVAYAQALRDNEKIGPKRAAAVAGQASRAQVAAVEGSQARFAGALAGARFGTKEMFRVSKALNGIAMEIDLANMGDLAKLPEVKRVIPLYLEHTTNSTSVTFIGTPNVWANNGLGLPAGADGTGIRVGVIDTGIDYMHPNFGGTGATATDYSNERTATAIFTTNGVFPTAKVAGGTDFAGDNYSGGNIPVPDSNPMDCGGHGSHVAGSAAGYGMTTGGATFAGPYDANAATYLPLLIGPGTAPKASLYALRVFGCAGSTGLTTQAIDWSMDPNGDADLSDHLDVINMSLGSNFGSAVNATSISSDNAALAGVIVVTSAGNAGDTFFISGAPGSASRAIATAASVDSGVPAPFVRINSPGSLGTGYIGGTAAFGPALTPTGTTGDAVVALDTTGGIGPTTTDGCDAAFTNAAAIAGKIAVIDRGGCGFAIKTKNAQVNGAIGVIIVNNAPGSAPPGMAGVDATITIPTASITLVDGNALKAGIGMGTVNVTLLGPSGDDTVASFSSRGARRIFGVQALRLKPDIAAPGLNITSTETGIVCTAQALPAGQCTGTADPSGIQVGVRSLTISGTSMASPHVAGIMALLRQLHPEWSVEELKALVMNYSIHDTTVLAGGTPPRYGPSRIGNGRVDPSKAAVGTVVAMNAEEAGLVSVTFDPEVVGVVSRIRKVRLVNKGTTSQTFDLAFDMTNDAPGVSFALPGGSSVNVPAGETVEIDVQMNANSNQMKVQRDPSLYATQGVQANYGDQPRAFLTEEEGYLTLSQGGNLKLRLALYLAERPSSMMSAADTIVTGGAPTGSTTIALSGADLCTGALAAGPTCTGTFPTDRVSLVSPFELHVVSPADPVNSTDYADIQYAGVSYVPGAPSNINNDLILFGVSSWSDWSTLNEVSYNICVDTNEDGIYDKSVYNLNPAIFVANASFQDVFHRGVRDLTTNNSTILGLGSFVNLISPSVIDTDLFLNSVMVLGATPAQLGMTAGDTTFRYKIVTCAATNSGCARTTTGDHCTPAPAARFDEAVGPYFWNWAAQGLNFGGNFLDEDLNGNSLPVSWNTANMATNGSLGALLLHHQNGAGKRAEVVLLDTAQRADLALTKTVDNQIPVAGSNVVFTLTVTNNGPNNATGVVVNDFLPIGINWVSDNSAGAYDPNTGLWTVGAIANGASATLNITASVDSTDPIANVAEITSVTPLDPNAANNRATATLQAPRSADLVLAFSANVPSANPGDSIIYTLTVTNNGDDSAYSVDVQEDFVSFPALNPVTYTPSQGVYNPATGHWDLASLPSGQSATLTFTVTAPNMAGNLVNNASTSSAKRVRVTGKAADPNTGNNTASAVVAITSPATVGTRTKTVTGSFQPGGAVTYTVTISNTGPFDQQNNPTDEFVDVLPAALSLVSATASSGTAVATIGTNTVTWNGAITVGGSVTITINAQVNAGFVGQVASNQGTINFDANGDGTNDTASQTDDPGVGGTNDPTTFTITSQASIGTRTKTVTGTFSPGGSVTYTITIGNAGPFDQLDNPGDEFVDILPAGVTLVSASATSGAANANVGTNTVTWNGVIVNGGSVTITINALVNTGFEGQVVSNQGTINYDADGNGVNEATILTDDPSLGGANDPTNFTVSQTAEIPTLSTVGLMIMAFVLAGGALLLLRRRSANA